MLVFVSRTIGCFIIKPVLRIAQFVVDPIIKQMDPGFIRVVVPALKLNKTSKTVILFS
jgi:hypothetical protein